MNVIVLTVHIQRREAFAVAPYRKSSINVVNGSLAKPKKKKACIGLLRFLNLNLSKHPLYPEILSRVISGQKLVDVGCCFAVDLRKLIADGASPSNVFGVELEQAFLDKGFELFRDADRLPKGSCIAEDMLSAETSSNLEPLLAQVDIVYMSSFYHLFDLQQQMAATRKVLKLIRRKPGTLLVGRHIGDETPGTYPKIDGGEFYRHNAASFEAMM